MKKVDFKDPIAFYNWHMAFGYALAYAVHKCVITLESAQGVAAWVLANSENLHQVGSHITDKEGAHHIIDSFLWPSDYWHTLKDAHECLFKNRDDQVLKQLYNHYINYGTLQSKLLVPEEISKIKLAIDLSLLSDADRPTKETIAKTLFEGVEPTGPFGELKPLDK